jgi:hypothetical protein
MSERREVRSAEPGEILGARDRRAGEDLAQVVSRVSNIGVQNVGIFDVDAGRVEGARGSFMIDENLLPKLRFVKEGEFAETKGAPTLRLIGDVETIEAGKAQPLSQVEPCRSTTLSETSSNRSYTPIPNSTSGTSSTFNSKFSRCFSTQLKQACAEANWRSLSGRNPTPASTR